MDLAGEATFHLGVLEVSPSTCQVAWPTGRQVLQPRVMQALVVLARAQGGVVSREMLIAECWGGRIVGEDAVTRVMVQLRRLAQGLDGPGYELETIPRVGYRLAAADAPGAPYERPRKPTMVGRRAVLAVGAVAVSAAAAGGALLLHRRWRAPTLEPLTLAVLPFSNLSSDPKTAYLALGSARAVRDALCRVSGLRVI